MPAVEASGLGKTYSGDISALEDLNLTIGEGAVFGLLGPNGAGKTTTVRLLNGTLEPSIGTANIFGQPALEISTKQITATLAEMAKMYDHLSAVENLKFYAAMYGIHGSSAIKQIQDLITRIGLQGRENDKVGTFSTGMKKRLQLARILLHKPKLIFLDEPTSGLDPDAARQVTELIKNLAKDVGTTVILCTHNLPVAEKVCDEFGFLSQGRLVAAGTKESLIADSGEATTVLVETQAGTESFPIQADDEINAHLRRIMDGGGQIREVKKNNPDLESLYFKYVGRSTNELG